MLSFPGDSNSKGTSCSAGDLGSIPGEDPLRRRNNSMQYYYWRISMERNSGRLQPTGLQKSWNTIELMNILYHSFINNVCMENYIKM